MIEALAEDGCKTLEDFATCADWELAGGWTTVTANGSKTTVLLEKFDVALKRPSHGDDSADSAGLGRSG